MKHVAATLALIALGATGLSASAEARSNTANTAKVGQQASASKKALASARGTPQRSSNFPPGLARLLADPNNGIARALIATEGSNSRLQDNPASP